MTIPQLRSSIQKYYLTQDDSDIDTKVQLRRSIIAGEIDDMMKDVPRPWKRLSEEVTGQWDKVRDMEYRQFPSYLLSIELLSEDDDAGVISRNRNLVLGVSLLGEYYTLFYEEEYFFPKMRADQDDHPPSYQFVFMKLLPDDSDDLQQGLETMQQICAKHFPNYQLVNHAMLMTTFMDGLNDYGQPEMLVRNAFSYLFDESWMRPHYKIISCYVLSGNDTILKIPER